MPSFKSALSGLRQFLANESPLKMMMKNAFYFTLKALIVLKIFQFLSSRFGNGEKTAWLERWNWFQNVWRHNLGIKISIHILSNISRSKCNQTIWLVNTIKHKKDFFLKNHSQNVLEKIFPDASLKFHTVYFYCMPKWGLS